MGATKGHVVVGYDGTPSAGAALERAAAEAVGRGVPLTVLHATDVAKLIGGPVGFAPWVPDEAEETTRALADEAVARVRALAPDLEVTTLTPNGPAAGALVEASRGAELVVMGSRGHRPLAGALLGSVAQTVSEHAHAPVMIVREGRTTVPGPDAPVVVGVDDSGSEDAVRFAAAAAARAKAPLIVACVWKPGPVDPWETAYWTHARPGDEPEAAAYLAAEDAARTAAKTAAELYPGLEVSERAVPGHAVAPTLADESKEAGLLVVGARGRGGFAGLRLGSVGRAAIHVAPCAVVVVHAEQAAQ